MSKNGKGKLSRTECVRIENEDALLVHVILEMRTPPKKPGRRAATMSGRVYHLIVHQGEEDILRVEFKAATKFPLAGMKDVLSGSASKVITDNRKEVANALKKLRAQLEKAETDANGNGG